MKIREIIAEARARDKYLIEKIGFFKTGILGFICFSIAAAILNLIFYSVDVSVSVRIIKVILSIVLGTFVYYKFGYELVKGQEEIKKLDDISPELLRIDAPVKEQNVGAN